MSTANPALLRATERQLRAHLQVVTHGSVAAQARRYAYTGATIFAVPEPHRSLRMTAWWACREQLAEHAATFMRTARGRTTLWVAVGSSKATHASRIAAGRQRLAQLERELGFAAHRFSCLECTQWVTTDMPPSPDPTVSSVWSLELSPSWCRSIPLLSYCLGTLRGGFRGEPELAVPRFRQAIQERGVRALFPAGRIREWSAVEGIKRTRGALWFEAQLQDVLNHPVAA